MSEAGVAEDVRMQRLGHATQKMAFAATPGSSDGWLRSSGRPGRGEVAERFEEGARVSKLVSVDVERSDWMWSPGRTVQIQVGRFGVGADSADGGSGWFGVSTRWFNLEVSFERKRDKAVAMAEEPS
jgi:hypothetical protein